MATAKNTRTGKIAEVPDHYIGHPVLGKDLELIGEIAVEVEVEAAPKNKKKPTTKYVPNAEDGDGDGMVQDGTEWERPVGTEIEEQPAPETTEE